jgi:EpsI family protein
MSVTRTTTQQHRVGRAVGLPLLAALIVVASGAYGLRALWPMLDETWSNIYGAFSHGYLVLALCVWLAVRQWREARPSELRPAWLATVLLIGLVLALVGMDVLFLNSSRLAVLPLVFLAAVAGTFGWAAARTVFWPSMFLYLALPQWWAINGMLQSLTTVVVSQLVKIANLPAYVEGNFIRVPAGLFEIASGCSGLNYLIAALSIAAFYCLMYLRHSKSRLILLAAAATAAMVANFVRIFALIVIGIVTDMQHYLVRVDHLYFGWAVFGLSMLPVLWLARKLEDADADAASPPDSRTPQAQGSTSVSVLPAAIVCGAILLAPAILEIRPEGGLVPMSDLPDRAGPWQRSHEVFRDWQPAFVNAQEERGRYVAELYVVDVYRGSYPRQTPDARLIRSENDFFGGGWRLAEQHSRAVSTGLPERVVESRGYVGERERLMWSWYVVAGKPVATKLGAKLQELAGFTQRRRDAAGIAISTECIPDCSAARERLARFTPEFAASLQ